MIETFPTYTADEPFAHHVGLWSAHRSAEHIDPSDLCHVSETRSIFLIIIANQEAWTFLINKVSPLAPVAQPSHHSVSGSPQTARPDLSLTR